MVTIKGSKAGIKVVLSENMTLEEAKGELKNKFSEAISFFEGERVKIILEGSSFSEFELFLLQGVIEDTLSGCEVIFEENNERESAAKVESCRTDEGITRFYQGTVRSGQVVETKGNLVVIGDANPGSELIAGGNIIVMGAARGIVHAGADGNRGAVVVALNLLPTQIRIADIISRCPDDEILRTEWVPEIAFIKDGAVYIEQYLTKKA